MNIYQIETPEQFKLECTLRGLTTEEFLRRYASDIVEEKYVMFYAKRIFAFDINNFELLTEYTCEQGFRINNKQSELNGGFLESFVGGPTVCKKYFYGSKKSITSLKGAPKYVGDDFSVCNTSITSLEYFPSQVDGNISLRDNTSLRSLKGIKQKITKDLDISGCTNLTSLEGAPWQVLSLNIANCTNLTNLDFAPRRIYNFYISTPQHKYFYETTEEWKKLGFVANHGN